MAQLQMLRITDGTNTIDLLSKNSPYGWKLRNATLNFPTFKGDGSWSDPITSSGRSLSDYNITNANDSYELTLKQINSDAFNSMLADLRSMLFKAASYWTNGINGPVWIEARGINESITRYAVVKAGYLDGEGSHWGATFFQPDCEPVMEFALGIERSLWRKYPPGGYEGIPTCSAYASALDGSDLFPLMGGEVAKITVGDTDALNLPDSSFVITIGVRVPEFIMGGAIYFVFGDDDSILISQDENFMSMQIEMTTTDSLTSIEIPSSFVGNLAFFDFVYDAEERTSEIYINGVRIPPQSQIAGVGTPVGHTDGNDYTFMGRIGRTEGGGSTMARYADGWSYIRIDTQNPFPIGNTRQNLGEIVYLFEETAGTTLDNAGTGGLANDGVISNIEGQPTVVLWDEIRNIFDYGKTICSTEPTIVTGIELPIPIDHVYFFDSSAASFSANLAQSSLPYLIVPANPETGDFLYVGSTSGRFTHLLFDIDPPLATIFDTTPSGISDAIWNAWQVARNSPTWESFPIRVGYDTTRAMFSSGPGNASGLASIDAADPWPRRDVNNVSAFWWRLPLVNNMTQSPFVAAFQNNYHIYTGHSFINIPEYEGDTNALGRYEFYGDSLSYMQRDIDSNGGEAISAVNRIAAGFRSESRGEDFVHDISVAPIYLPDKIASGTFMPTVIENPQIPGGFATQVNMPAVPASNPRILMGSWVIQRELAAQYTGTFKLFARVATSVVGVGDLGDSTGRLEAEISMGSIKFNADNRDVVGTILGSDVLSYPEDSNRFLLYEVGTIRIPDSSRYNFQSEVSIDIYFRHVNVDSDTDLIFLSDIVLIPVDEYAFTVTDGDIDEISGRIALGTIINSPTFLKLDMQTRKNLLLDSVTWERDALRAFEFIDTHNPLIDIPEGGVGKFDDGVSGVWKYDSAQKVIVPNVPGGGRMFFAFPYNEYQTAIQVQIYANPEFYSLGEYS